MERQTRSRRRRTGYAARLSAALLLIAALSPAAAGTASWTPTADTGQDRGSPPSVLLLDGRVLIAGGDDGTANGQLADVQIWSPATGQWSPTDNAMSTERDPFAATILESGKVLAAGGVNG